MPIASVAAMVLLPLFLFPAYPAEAGQAMGQVRGQPIHSLHAARNMAALNRMPQVQAKERFIPLQARRGAIPLRQLAPAETAARPAPVPARAEASPSPASEPVMLSQLQAQQILSIFAPAE
ncbi:MAG: hypothetical protein SFW63_03930 [Alphaproteobacteria bacterium]|nr:hypothetical protein [Alphaproteobacteria bacterium]